MTNNVSFLTLFRIVLFNCTIVPPYGQGEVEEVQSIFEISHLRTTALLLDIQCKLYLIFFVFKF